MFTTTRPFRTLLLSFYTTKQGKLKGITLFIYSKRPYACSLSKVLFIIARSFTPDV